MEEKVIKKRAWVKNAVIAFLCVMLVLTFFSNTIMNRSLPEVATAYVESGSINAKIRGSGTVAAGESYDVVLDQTRKVASVVVRVGDTVQAGDILFTLAETQSEELKQAMDRLDDMRLDYQKSVLNMDTADYTLDNRNIQKTRDALAEAQSELQSSAVTDQQLLDMQTALRDTQRMEKQLNDTLTQDQTTLATVQKNHDDCQSRIDAATAEIERLDKDIDDLEDQIDDLRHGSGDPEAQLTREKDKLKSAERDYAEKRIIYGADYDSLESKAETISDGKQSIIAQMQALVAGKDNLSLAPTHKATAEEAAAFNTLQPILDKLDTISAEITRLKTLVTGQETVYSQISTLEDTLEDKEDTRDDLEAEVKSSKKQLEVLEKGLRSAQQTVEFSKYQLESCTANIEQLTENYDDLKSLKERHDAAKSNVKELQATLDEQLFQLSQKKKADGKLAASQQLDLDKAQQDIQEQEALVDELQANALGGEVVAAVSGQISTLNVSAGREAAAGETLAVIEVVDRGYTVRIPVTMEQSKKVRLGDKGEITNYYWGEQLDVTLTQIINDPANPGKGKLLVFTLVGDVSSGQNVTVSVGEKSANFDAIIPNSALRTDSNGTFVLAVLAKSSPLGNRYIATRVDVQVLAQDDTTAAVSGLSSGDYVITTSSKPLDAGMQVNMVEN